MPNWTLTDIGILIAWVKCLNTHNSGRYSKRSLAHQKHGMRALTKGTYSADQRDAQRLIPSPTADTLPTECIVSGISPLSLLIGPKRFSLLHLEKSPLFEAISGQRG